MVIGKAEEATEAANALVSKFRFLFDLYGWVTKKNWDTQNFLTFVSSCQDIVKIKLTFTITVDSYLDSRNAESN
jgi:hypothetical protein